MLISFLQKTFYHSNKIWRFHNLFRFLRGQFRFVFRRIIFSLFFFESNEFNLIKLKMNSSKKRLTIMDRKKTTHFFVLSKKKFILLYIYKTCSSERKKTPSLGKSGSLFMLGVFRFSLPGLFPLFDKLVLLVMPLGTSTEFIYIKYIKNRRHINVE